MDEAKNKAMALYGRAYDNAGYDQDVVPYIRRVLKHEEARLAHNRDCWKKYPTADSSEKEAAEVALVEELRRRLEAALQEEEGMEDLMDRIDRWENGEDCLSEQEIADLKSGDD